MFLQEQYYSCEFSIAFPSNWAIKRNQMGAALIGIAPLAHPADTFAPNVNVNVVDNSSGLDLDQFYSRQFDANAALRILRDFSMIQQGDATIGSRPVKQVVYVHRTPTHSLKVLAYLVLAGATGYVITCSATVDRFEEYLPTFEAICACFRP
jgi:hypothetical protein